MLPKAFKRGSQKIWRSLRNLLAGFILRLLSMGMAFLFYTDTFFVCFLKCSYFWHRPFRGLTSSFFPKSPSRFCSFGVMLSLNNGLTCMLSDFHGFHSKISLLKKMRSQRISRRTSMRWLVVVGGMSTTYHREKIKSPLAGLYHSES